MTTDHHSATTRNDEVATAPVGHRQSSLVEVGDDGTGATAAAEDGARQTTLGAHVEGVEPVTDEATDGATDETETVNAFPMRDVLLVKHYFEGDEAFAALEPYYNQREYRFEIPQRALREVQVALEEHEYELAIVDYLEPYAVVVRKYSHHPESVFEDAVAEFSNADFNVFVLKSEAAVETAVRSGAQRLSEAPVEVRFPTAHGTGPLTVDDVTPDEV